MEGALRSSQKGCRMSIPLTTGLIRYDFQCIPTDYVGS